jgi:parallel beta-helix repeat protein
MGVERVKPLLLMFFLCMPYHVLAVTWYVHPDSALNSIQDGLDLCAAYDTVLVGAGTYYEIIEWPYLRGINLISEYGPETTIINAQENGSVIYLSLMPDDSLTLVHGFTLKNGSAWQGGGIYSIGGKPTISGNVITRCTCQWPTEQEYGPPPRGGGIYTEWSSPLISDNIITSNTANEGGGISCLADAANIAPTIIKNTITLNSAGIGGGIEIIHPFTMTVVRENVIFSNTADYGGGIACYYVFNPLLTIVKNTICGNIADSAGGGIWCYISSRPFIDSCIIAENVNDGIYSGYFSAPVIRYNNITDNEGCGVRNVDQTLVVLAESNWWGHATGPYNPLTNPGGLGDTVSHFVDYDPWLTSPGTEEPIPKQPADVLLRVEPNPFRQNLQIRLTIHDSRFMIEKPQLSVYDAAGRSVKSFLLSTTYYILPTAISWDGIDDAGQRLPSGVYFVRLKVGDHTETEKIVLLR